MSCPQCFVSQFIPLLSLADTRCPLAIHVRPTTQSPNCVVENVCHWFTGWEKKDRKIERRWGKVFCDNLKKKERITVCTYLTLYLWHKAQALLKVRTDAMQTQAKLGVTVIFASATSVIADIKLVTALCHSGDPQVKLSRQRTVLYFSNCCG